MFEQWVGKLKENRIVKYYRAHIWCEIGLWFCVGFLGLTLIFQTYMKREYYQYLLDQSALMERVVLDTMQQELVRNLSREINTSCEAAIAQDLFTGTEKACSLGVMAGQKERLDLISLLRKYSRYSSNVVSLAVYGENEEVFQYDKQRSKIFEMWDEDNRRILETEYHRLMNRVDESGKGNYIVSTDGNVHPANDGLYVFHAFYPMIGNQKSLKDISSMLCVTYDMGIFDSFLKMISEDGREYIEGYVTDGNGVILYHEDKDVIGRREADYISEANLKRTEKDLQFSGWKLNIAIDRNRLQEMINRIFMRGFTVFILLMVLFQIVLYLLLTRMLSPVKKIKNAMDDITDGGGQKKITVQGYHEVWRLADHYNGMIEALEEKEQAVQKQHREQLIALKCQQQAEWEMLASQINAHFISNTLGVINYEAIESGNNHIANMIKILSNILRYTFDRKCQKVMLGQEIQWIGQYLYLQKERFEDMFDYSIDFDDSFRDWPCCKMMLQPFVENAMLHGFAGRETGGYLEIKGVPCGEKLKLLITDNGRGMEEEQAEKLGLVFAGHTEERPEGSGIGITNTVRRILDFYGEHVTMELRSVKGKGSTVILLIDRMEEEAADENSDRGR